MSSPAFAPDFQRAFVSMRYFLGARDQKLGAPLGDAPAAAVAEERLAQPERARRAEALAVEIGRIVRALEARNFR
jgi:hypothetical protein